MARFKMPSFTTKMMLSYILMALIAIVLAVGSVYSIKLSLVRSQDQMTENEFRTHQAHSLHDTFEERRISQGLFKKSPDEALISNWVSADHEFSKLLKSLESQDNDKTTRNSLATITALNKIVVKNWNSLVTEYRKNNQVNLDIVDTEKQEDLEANINLFVNSEIKIARSSESDALSDVANTLNLALIISAAVLMFALLMAYYISSTLKRPLAQLLEGTQRISKGQLGHKIELDRTDEIGTLTSAFDEMSMELQTRQKQINDHVENLQTTKTLLETYSRELEITNKELESFIYSVSHDLKSPLIAIQGFLSMFDHEFKDKLSDKAQYYLSRVQVNGQQMHTLIKQLLNLSKVGQFANNLENVDSRAIVEDILADLSVQIETKKAITKLGDNWPQIVCDPSRLKQALINLVDNALHYNHDSRQLMIEIRVTESDDYWRFSVIDNGMGIDPMHQERIFDIFERLSSAHDLNQNGTGMGLAIVRRIAESHDGKVSVESKLDDGAKFFFDISKKLTIAEPAKAEV